MKKNQPGMRGRNRGGERAGGYFVTESIRMGTYFVVLLYILLYISFVI